MQASDGGRTLRRIEREEDAAYCAAEDVTATVPILRDGDLMRVVALEAAARSTGRARLAAARPSA